MCVGCATGYDELHWLDIFGNGRWIALYCKKLTLRMEELLCGSHFFRVVKLMSGL
jgi:hypothetical protein